MHESLEQRFLDAYDRHADALFAFCRAFLRDRERAKDAVQEAFTRTWAHLAGGRRVDDFRPFLYRTARNLMIDAVRRMPTQSLEELQEGGTDIAADGPGPAVVAEASRAVRLAAALPPQEREAVLLRYAEGLMPRDIAVAVGASENAVSVRIHRGLAKLRRLMGIRT